MGPRSGWAASEIVGGRGQLRTAAANESAGGHVKAQEVDTVSFWNTAIAGAVGAILALIAVGVLSLVLSVWRDTADWPRARQRWKAFVWTHSGGNVNDMPVELLELRPHWLDFLWLPRRAFRWLRRPRCPLCRRRAICYPCLLCGDRCCQDCTIDSFPHCPPLCGEMRDGATTFAVGDIVCNLPGEKPATESEPLPFFELVQFQRGIFAAERD